MKKYTIEDLQTGKVSLHLNNKDSLKALNIILNRVFYKSKRAVGTSQYYHVHSNNNKRWDCSDIKPSINIVTVDQFYYDNFTEQATNEQTVQPESKTKLIGYKLNGKATQDQVQAVLRCGSGGHNGLFFNCGPTGTLISMAKDLGILDIWFTPVYEEEELKMFFVEISSGERVKVTKEKVTISNRVVDIPTLKKLLICPKYLYSTYYIKATSWVIGCISFTREDVERVIEAYEELQ